MKSNYIKRRKRRKRALGLACILLALMLILTLIDQRLYPIVKDFAEAGARSYANGIINSTVVDWLSGENLSYEDIILLQRDEAGGISSLEVNAPMINRIKSEAVVKIKEKIDQSNCQSVSIPLGNLTGSSYLAGRGPCLDIKLSISSNISASLQSEFYSTGINQSLHIIKLNITATVFILLPLGKTSVEHTDDFLIGQSVIVGEVPSAFTEVFDVVDDLDGTVNDYGAVTP